jgi:hypothetical protein
METVMKPIQKIIMRTVSGSARSRRRLLRRGALGGGSSNRVNSLQHGGAQTRHDLSNN